MSDHLKLTDEVLRRIRVSVREACIARGEPLCDEEVVAAIRALRDAAMSVVTRARSLTELLPDRLVDADDFNALAALLPDEPKGGGS